MLRYILRRLAGAVVVMLALSFLVFSLLYLVPGDPVKILVGTRRLTPEVRQAVTARYGLDEPLLLRYWHWLTRALTGDFGDSVRSATPVTDVLSSRVSLTAWLTIGALPRDAKERGSTAPSSAGPSSACPHPASPSDSSSSMFSDSCSAGSPSSAKAPA